MINSILRAVKRAVFLIFILSLGLTSVWAEEITILVDRPTFSLLPVRIWRLEGPEKLSVFLEDVLRKDLELHLAFKILKEPPIKGTPLKEYLISGKVLGLYPSLRISFKLEDLWMDAILLHKAFQGPREAGRYMVHRFVDQAVREMLGFSGVAYSRVVFVKRTSEGDALYVMDYDQYNLRLLYKAPIILSPRLSPSGRYLAFVSYKKGRPEVKVLAFATGKLWTVAAYPGLNASPVWHPDEKRLVVTLSKDGNPDLYLIDLKGRILKRLTFGEGVNTGGSFSPDGRRLAFVSDRTGSPQIYLYDLLTGGTRRLTFKGRYNVSPSWSPKGDRIVYAGNQKGKFVLFTLDPEEGHPVAISEEGSYEAPVFAPNGMLVMAVGKGPEGRGLYVFMANGAVKKFYLPGKEITAVSWSRLP